MEIKEAGFGDVRIGDLVGVIRHRLLINRLADPAEVAPRLPPGMTPHVSSSGGVVVGCCLLAIESARPWPLPTATGLSIRAAAHRISVDVPSKTGETTRAVYVPCRHTDGLLPVLAGGRVTPGVHRRAEIDVELTPDEVAWSVRGRQRARTPQDSTFDIAAVANREGATEATSEVADIVIGTVLGVSPGHRPGSMERADLCPTDLTAHRVELTSLRSAFLDGFSTAEPAETLLMTNVGVVWSRA